MDGVLRGALDQLERAQSRKLEFLQSMKRQAATSGPRWGHVGATSLRGERSFRTLEGQVFCVMIKGWKQAGEVQISRGGGCRSASTYKSEVEVEKVTEWK